VLQRMGERPHFGLPASLGLPQIVLNLHAEPELRGSAESRRQPQGHGRRDASVTIENARQMCPRYAKPGSGFLHAQISQIIFQNVSRVRRVENHIALLVIIPIVNENHVLASKAKVSLQLPLTLTAQWPASSPFNGCRLLPGAFISPGVLATSRAVSSLLNRWAWAAWMPGLEPVSAKSLRPLRR